MEDTWVAPDACTLPTAEQGLRVAEFHVLFSRALTTVERVGPTHVRLGLRRAPGVVEEVRDLVERETQCCSFFEFVLTSDEAHDEVMLEVGVPAAQVDVLSGLVHRAEAARGS